MDIKIVSLEVWADNHGVYEARVVYSVNGCARELLSEDRDPKAAVARAFSYLGARISDELRATCGPITFTI